jgi:hypothetical protein
LWQLRNTTKPGEKETRVLLNDFHNQPYSVGFYRRPPRPGQVKFGTPCVDIKTIKKHLALWGEDRFPRAPNPQMVLCPKSHGFAVIHWSPAVEVKATTTQNRTAFVPERDTYWRVFCCIPCMSISFPVDRASLLLAPRTEKPADLKVAAVKKKTKAGDQNSSSSA